MDFRLSQSQQELQDQARGLLTERFSPGDARDAEASADGFPRVLWDAGAKLGWPAMSLAADVGGGGHGLLHQCVLAEELGRVAASTPLVISPGVVGTMLKRSPGGAIRDRLIEHIAGGAIISPALIDQDGRNEWDAARLRLHSTGDAYRMSGTKVLVPFAQAASELLVTAETERGETALVAVPVSDEGVARTVHKSNVGVPLASVQFTDVLVPADRLINVGDDARVALEAGLAVGSLLATAEAVGMCEALIALTAEYVSRREAFGRPIGTFQAVAHPCADMRVSVDAIRILVQQAAWLVDNGLPADEEIPATKALANEHFERVANDAYRLHGARGFSTECDVQLYTRRLHGFFGSFGETQESFQRAAAALGI